MIARVITIATLPQSITAARQCIESAERFGLKVEPHFALTPADDPRGRFRRLGWPTTKFEHNRYSRPLPCMACFLSHAQLWLECVATREPVIICEHDCHFVAPLPDLRLRAYLVNLARPSFGKFKQPSHGIGPLVSKPHLPGATCYFVQPQGARELLRLAATEAEPTDVFLSLKRFPWIREAFPWPAECRETFTSIQREAGCAAKHRPVMIV